MATKNIFDPSISYSPSAVSKQRTALLLLDYQSMIVSILGENGQKPVDVANDMRQWAKRNNVPVYFCTIDTKDAPASTNKISSRWGNYQKMFKETPEVTQITPALSPAEDEKMFARKPGTISVFTSPGFLDELKAKDIQSLIIGGLSTSGCTLSTTRAATDLGFMATVVEDACADPAPGVHDACVNYILPMVAHVAPAKEVQGMWGTSS